MPTSITLQQLQYFLSAVEHGSLSAAADAHFIAQAQSVGADPPA